MNKEYIVKLLFTNYTNDYNIKIYHMNFISNYGRILKSEPIIFVNNNEIEDIMNEIYNNIKYKPYETNQEINYRIPKLFIDVIDAFHTQNTDLMQECYKKYLDITRESKIKDSILKDLELNNKLKEKDDIIKSKDIELEDKNKIIISQQQEINKLKEELMKFKKSLSNLIGE